MPLVSIITPMYNSECFIMECVDSVRAQTFSNWEMIIVDDCSSDQSLELAKRASEVDSRIKVFSLTSNSGAAVARNKAIEIAVGRYIAFLDSDDLWLPTKLKCQLDFMREHDIALSYTAYEKIDDRGDVVGQVGVPERVGYKSLLKVCSIGCLTAMYDSEKLGKITMPLIRKRQDLGLWLKILKLVEFGYGLDEVQARYRVREGSISSNKRSAAKYTWRLYRDVEKLGLGAALYYFSCYAVNGMLRHKFPSLARFFGVLK